MIFVGNNLEGRFIHMEFKLNKRLYIGVGIALIISGLLLVIIPLIALSLNPNKEMVDLVTKLSIVGGILFIPGLMHARFLEDRSAATILPGQRQLGFPFADRSTAASG